MTAGRGPGAVGLERFAEVRVGVGQVLCKRCGKVAGKLASPPFRNDLGNEIYENICAECWREAIGQKTKVISELRLPMNDPQAHKVWDQHIRDFLNLQNDVVDWPWRR